MRGLESKKGKFAIYSRKSKFTGKGESIENQIELCRQYIFSNYSGTEENDIVVFEDEGFSGKNTDRPQFKSMMKMMETKEIKAVVCYRLDRISRNVGDFAKLIESLDEMGVDFISVRERFATDDKMGKAMMYMSSVFSQLERETIAERILDNMHELAKTGRWLGGTTPTGYESKEINSRIEIDGKARKMHKLEIIEEEANLIKLIFKKFIETNSLTKVDEYLLINNIKTKNGKDFTRFALRSILANPVYMSADLDAWNYFESLGVEVYADKKDFDGKYGMMAYNKTKQNSNKSHDIRDISEWIIAIGKHEPLVSGADWVKVQQLLSQNKSKTYRKPKSTYALLSGLLYCENCGAFMRPKVNRRVLPNGEKSFSYLCETKERTHKQHCDMKNPSGNELDLAVCNEIKKLSSNKLEFFKKINESKKIMGRLDNGNKSELQMLKIKINENEKKIEALVNSLTKAVDTPAYDYIFKEINELHSQNEKIQNTITDLNYQIQQNSLAESEFDILETILSNFAESFDLMSYEEKRSALRVFVDKVTWDGENVHIYFFGADKDSKEGVNGAKSEAEARGLQTNF